MLDSTPPSTVEMATFHRHNVVLDETDVKLLFDNGRTSARVPLDKGSACGVRTDETDCAVEVGE